MHISVKYLILIAGFVAAYFACCKSTSSGAGIVAAGAFISYALIEVQDLKNTNDKEE